MLADVPKGWREVRIGDVTRRVRREVKPDPAAIYPLLGIRLYGTGLRWQGENAGAGLKAPSLCSVEEGDIIFNKMWASKGAFAVAEAIHAGGYVTSEYPCFVATDDAVVEFLKFVLMEAHLWRLAESWSKGTTDRARLGPKDFMLMPIKLPPLADQRAIAAVLSAASGALARQEDEIAKLVLAKQSIMRQLLTGRNGAKKRRWTPLDKPWTIGRIAEGVVEIPSDWELVRLTNVAKLESGHTPDRKMPEYWDCDIPWISLQDAGALAEATISETAETIGFLGLKNSSARLLPEGTVVLQRTASVGLCSIMGREMATSQHFANWVCGGDLLPGYLMQVFRHMGREWSRLSAGSVLPDIYMSDFKKLEILLPPKPEQEKIAEVGAAFDARIAAERKVLEELEATKAALAPELLSGRERLPASMIARYEDPERKVAVG